MTHFALVMFFKAIVVLIGAAIVEQWQAFKARKKAEGLQMRLDPKSGVYVVDDRIERFEKFLKRARIAFWVFVIPYGAFCVYVLVYY